MISLVTAQKLKDAGLEWIPKYGDMCYQKYNEGLKSEHIKLIAVVENSLTCSEIFAPRIDQLLAEIEERSWYYRIDSWTNPVVEMRYSCTAQKYHNESIYGEIIKTKQFYADSPEEAAAQALLWIMEQEAKV